MEPIRNGLQALRQRLNGTLITADEAGYEARRQALVWNALKPARSPRAIVRAASEQDVVEAVRYARDAGQRVSVRGGGHSWIGFSLRDEGLLIDVGQLQGLAIDEAARVATVQPAVTGRQLDAALAPRGLAFPVGHCPSVALSGYLLNGGFGWNSNAWGPACFSLLAARVVTAAGEVLEVDEQRHPDLFWAIRGGGPGFCGVVTQYTLQLQAAPRAIRTSTYYYPLAQVAQVGEWLAQVCGPLPKEIEVNLHIATPSRFDAGESASELACIVTATAFVDSADEAQRQLAFLDRCPQDAHCWKKEVNRDTPVQTLYRQADLLYPEGRRYQVSTLWTEHSVDQMLTQARALFERAPSRESFALYGFSTGLGENPGEMPETAFSMSAQALMLHYAVWQDAGDDRANLDWHRDLCEALNPFAVGHYIGETDLALHPERAERCFAPEAWQRLQALRQTHDPQGLFHGHFAVSSGAAAPSGA